MRGRQSDLQDVLGDIRRRPAATEQRAAPRLPHPVEADEVDAGNGETPWRWYGAPFAASTPGTRIHEKSWR